MKITCFQKDLMMGINTALKAIPVRTTLPILECILIKAENGEIKLTSNNMEMAIETKVEGAIEKDGYIALDAKLLSDIVRKLPDSPVKLETYNDNSALIECEKSKFMIAGKKGDDFVLLPGIDSDNVMKISEFSLKEIIRQTIFSISDNDSNQLLKGELFQIKDDQFTVASLDGHRISMRTITLQDKYNDERVVVPGKTLSEITKILSGEKEKNVNIYFAPQSIMFELENTKIVSRLIDGEYYRLERMISSDYDTKIIINKKEFQDCLERAALFDREGDRKPVILDIENSDLNIRIESIIGNMNENIDIKKEGEDLVICFNPRYLLDALRVIDEEEITVYMTNSKAPGTIMNDGYVYLIVPINYNVGSRS